MTAAAADTAMAEERLSRARREAGEAAKAVREVVDSTPAASDIRRGWTARFSIGAPSGPGTQRRKHAMQHAAHTHRHGACMRRRGRHVSAPGDKRLPVPPARPHDKAEERSLTHSLSLTLNSYSHS
ncbi:hypothetical protein CDD83_5684 [Cordyceps sp. RAO-2017]|nr:hypothetical protein CDD83_5684 [Cordyceps sp. RAO-2017]